VDGRPTRRPREAPSRTHPIERELKKGMKKELDSRFEWSGTGNEKNYIAMTETVV